MNNKKTGLKDTHESYSTAVQKLLLSFMLTDTVAFGTSQNIIKAEYFDAPLRAAARFILSYASEHKTVPTPALVEGNTGTRIELFDSYQHHQPWYIATIENFCRFKALEIVILEGVDLLESGQGAEVEKRVKDAMQVSLVKDLGLDYFLNPLERLERMRDRSNFVSTGWLSLDQKLGGGFTKGALNIFAGGPGSGKSLVLQNLALNFAFAGMRVLYVTLELSCDLVSLRLDAMVTGKGTKEIFPNMKEVAYTIHKSRMESKGALILKKMPESATNANDIRAYVKEYEVKTGHKFDAICIDYLDLLVPNNSRVDPSNLFIRDKYISEESRSLAAELDVIMVTASQLNRGSIQEQSHDLSHVAGGISKANTADNLVSLLSTAAMRERGEYLLQFLKTRSSSAVGSQMSLAYDPVSMRMSDLDQEMEKIKPMSSDELRQDMKAKLQKQDYVAATLVSGENTSDPPASGQRNDVRALMNKIRKTNDS